MYGPIASNEAMSGSAASLGCRRCTRSAAIFGGAFRSALAQTKVGIEMSPISGFGGTANEASTVSAVVVTPSSVSTSTMVWASCVRVDIPRSYCRYDSSAVVAPRVVFGNMPSWPFSGAACGFGRIAVFEGAAMSDQGYYDGREARERRLGEPPAFLWTKRGHCGEACTQDGLTLRVVS